MVCVRELSLVGHGGDAVAAERFALAEFAEPRPAVVLAHEVFGLEAFARDAARRLAKAGYVVLVPDLYSREGLPGPSGGPSAWKREQIQAAVEGLPDRRAVADLEAAAAFLATDPEVDPERIAAIGFCLGGKLAFLLGCQSRRLGAVIDFYGQVRYASLDANHPVQPLEMSLGLECPLLAVFGEQDSSIRAEDIDAMRQQLSAFAKPFEIEVVPGVGHGFLNPQYGTHDASAAEEAWARALAFLEETFRYAH
jgi:carboxymethylenebutenolidase